MDDRTLRLQPRPQQVDRIHDARSDRAAKRPDCRSRNVAGSGGGGVFGDIEHARRPGGEFLFEVFEGGEIDGAVGEYTDQAHGEAAVEGADAGGRGVELLGGAED